MSPRNRTDHEVAIADILIGDRYRRDMGDLRSLADSIAAEGLINPISITERSELVAGERRLRAMRDVLGRTTIAARVVNVSSILAGEFAENVMRKDFTVSERVAIATAIQERIGDRHGERTDMELPDAHREVPKGVETIQHVAALAGFGSETSLKAARTVVEHGSPELVAAVDSGAVPITVAAELTKLDPEKQASVVANGRLSVQAAAKELRGKARDEREALVPRVKITEIAEGTFPCTFPGCARGLERPFPNSGDLGNHRFAAHNIRSTNVESAQRQGRRDRYRAITAAIAEQEKQPVAQTRPDAKGIRPGALDRGEREILRRAACFFIDSKISTLRRKPEAIASALKDLLDDDIRKPVRSASIGVAASGGA